MGNLGATLALRRRGASLEEEGILVVPNAGEVLYRPRETWNSEVQ
jgi:hypothetical protein